MMNVASGKVARGHGIVAVVATFALSACAGGPRSKDTVCPPDLAARGCGVTDQWRPRFPQTSLVAILSDPRPFEGAELTTAGYISTRFEDRRIYLDNGSYQYGLSENAVWLFVSDEQLAGAAIVSGDVVTVDGVYRSGSCEHVGTRGCIFVNESYGIEKVESFGRSPDDGPPQ